MSRHALVTGGSAGLGFAAAMALAAAGCRLTLAARNGERLEAARGRIAAVHPAAEIKVIPCDLEDAHSVAALIGMLGDSGMPDIVVHVAGGPRLYAPGAEDEAELRRHLQSHSLSLIAFMQTFAPVMQERGFGRFIAIMSRAVGEPRADNPLSAAVRLPAWAMMKSWSRSSGFSNVTFNALLPGLFDTERFRQVCVEIAEQKGEPVEQARRKFLAGVPAGRLGRPEELASLAALLASDMGGYINGQRIVIDGGSSSGL
jgi:3-oxoacyl-[acyl-carrier protein] reductase